MSRIILVLLVGAMALSGQSVSPAGPPPSELSPEIAAALAKEGYAIKGADGQVYAEIWLRAGSVDGAPSAEQDVTWNTVAHGTLIGAIRYAGEGEDRRGQKIAPGLYTLRFSFYPVDGAHMGVEPSRDFLILSRADEDKDPTATPDFKALMDMSRKASRTQHPASIPCWKVDPGEWKAGLEASGEDWILSVKIGETPISVIVKGVNAHS